LPNSSVEGFVDVHRELDPAVSVAAPNVGDPLLAVDVASLKRQPLTLPESNLRATRPTSPCRRDHRQFPSTPPLLWDGWNLATDDRGAELLDERLDCERSLLEQPSDSFASINVVPTSMASSRSKPSSAAFQRN